MRMDTSRHAATQGTTARPAPSEIQQQVQRTVNEANAAIREAGQAAREASLAAQAAGRNGVAGGVLAPGAPPAPPGTPVIWQPPVGFGRPEEFPPQVKDISIAFFLMCAVIVIGWPIARAFGKRLERRTDAPVVNAGMAEQLQRIEQAVDAMSIEIERISESQRFMARLQNAQAPEPARELKA